MKTPAEIKKAFECCMQIQGCKGCPYSGFKCVYELSKDALIYIRQLESNQSRWRSPKVEPPDVDTFYAVTKFDPEIRIYKKNLIDQHYTTEWLNIRNDILYWMPIPEVPKE